ncbi:MAG TPA: hypothetical protein VKP30_31705 [Polyangiaceae bacterium]|nr:hypothetical protein [Polyangiaceae bacterium]
MDSVEVFEQNLRTVRNFSPMSDQDINAVLARTATSAQQGEYEQFKTSQKLDGTGRNPHWLEEARI